MRVTELPGPGRRVYHLGRAGVWVDADYAWSNFSRPTGRSGGFLVDPTPAGPAVVRAVHYQPLPPEGAGPAELVADLAPARPVAGLFGSARAYAPVRHARVAAADGLYIVGGLYYAPLGAEFEVRQRGLFSYGPGGHLRVAASYGDAVKAPPAGRPVCVFPGACTFAAGPGGAPMIVGSPRFGVRVFRPDGSCAAYTLPGQPVIPHPWDFELSPDGRTLAVGSDAGLHLFAWTADGPKCLRTIAVGAEVRAVSFDPDGLVLAFLGHRARGPGFSPACALYEIDLDD